MTAIVNVLSQKMLTFFTCLLGFFKYSNTAPQGHTNTDEGRQMDKDRHNHLVWMSARLEITHTNWHLGKYIYEGGSHWLVVKY